MTTVHKNLTGADLHEPKGADTAIAGQVYVSNGSGSGVWTTASSIITNTAFTTGDIKPTWKTTADTSWIMADDGSIGDGSSGATNRANADTSALFTLIWTNFSNSLAAVSGGRGASAAADFAAHKTIALPKVLGRALGVSGAGSGLTSRILGSTTGVEAEALTLSQLPTGITSANTGGISLTVNSPSANVDQGIGVSNVAAGGNAINTVSSQNFLFSTGNLAIGAVPVTSNNTSGATHSLMQPTAFINIMVKL